MDSVHLPSRKDFWSRSSGSKECPIMSYENSFDFFGFLQSFHGELPRHDTQHRRIAIDTYSGISFDITRDDITRWFASVRIDQVVVISPFSLRACTAREKWISEKKGPDNFIRIHGAFESDIPVSSRIYVSSEIYQKSVVMIEQGWYHIEEISLPDSSELEFYTILKKDFMIMYFYIMKISIIFLRVCRASVSEAWELFSDRRIKISMCFLGKRKCKRKHFPSIIIEYCMFARIELSEPVILSESRKFLLKMRKSFYNRMKIFFTGFLRIDLDREMGADTFKGEFLHD